MPGTSFYTRHSAEGPEGLALNYVMESLSNLLIMETKSYFSAHMFIERDGLDRVIGMTLNAYLRDPSRQTDIVDTVTGDAVSRPEVWDQALDVSLKRWTPGKIRPVPLMS